MPEDASPVERPLGASIAVGAASGLGVGTIVFFLIAIPFYTLASFEPNGLDRPVVRTGLFLIALPVGGVVAVVAGVVAGWWYRRGRRWTVDSGADRYTTR